MIKERKTICFGLPKKFDKNLKHEIDFIIKNNELLAENAINTRLVNYCPNICMIAMFETQQTVKQMNHTNLLFICHRY